MTGAEVLREAAALMRERAEAASRSHPGAWLVGDMEDEHATLYYVRTAQGGYDGAVSEVIASQSAATHIASWDPAVALSVANWLDGVATAFEDGDHLLRPDRGRALAVARAFLGEAISDTPS